MRKRSSDKAGDGEVALDAAGRIAQLGVGDRARRPGDAVGAHVLEEDRRARPDHLELGEGGLVEQRGRLATGAVLGADRRRPDPSGPAVGAKRLVAGRVVATRTS